MLWSLIDFQHVWKIAALIFGDGTCPDMSHVVISKCFGQTTIVSERRAFAGAYTSGFFRKRRLWGQDYITHNAQNTV